MKKVPWLLSIFVCICNFWFVQSSQGQSRQAPHPINDSVSAGTDTSFRYTPSSEVSFEKIYREIITLLDQGKYDEAMKYFSYDQRGAKEDKFLSEKEKKEKAASIRSGGFPDIVEVRADGIDVDTGEGILYMLARFKSGDLGDIPIIYTFKKEDGRWVWNGLRIALIKKSL